MAELEVKIKNLDRTLKAINKEVKELLTSEDILQVASFARELIYKRTKSGKGVSFDASTPGVPQLEDLDNLSSSYINKRLKNRPRGKFSSPRRSNLTNTGQMLDAMETRKVKDGATIIIRPSTRSDTYLTNEDVAFYASILRPFFNLSDSELKSVNAKIERMVRDKLRRLRR